MRHAVRSALQHDVGRTEEDCRLAVPHARESFGGKTDRIQVVRESTPQGSIMQISLEPKIELRSKIARIAAAVGLALVIGSFGVGSARAADNHGGNYHGGDQHHDNGYHGGGYRGP